MVVRKCEICGEAIPKEKRIILPGIDYLRYFHQTCFNEQGYEFQAWCEFIVEDTCKIN